MPQGVVKRSKLTNAGSKKPSAPKKGQRFIAPKKRPLKAKQKMVQKHSASMISRTEKSLAEKAGHLELLGGGKKHKASAATGKEAKKK